MDECQLLRLTKKNTFDAVHRSFQPIFPDPFFMCPLWLPFLSTLLRSSEPYRIVIIAR